MTMTFKLGHLNFFSLKSNFFTFMYYIIFFNHSILCKTMTFHFNFTQTWMIDMGGSLMFNWFRLELGYLSKLIKSFHIGNSVLVVLFIFSLLDFPFCHLTFNFWFTRVSSYKEYFFWIVISS